MEAQTMQENIKHETGGHANGTIKESYGSSKKSS